MNFNVRAIRERAGLSQRKFAQRLGVSQTAVRFWENGTKKPNPAQVENIGATFPVETASQSVDPLWPALLSVFHRMTPRLRERYVDTLTRNFSPK